MGFLDELKKDADAARGREHDRQRLLAEREGVYQQTMRPVLRRAMNTLRELVDHVSVLPEGVELGFDFPVIGRIEHLRAQNWRIQVDSTERPTRVALAFEASAPAVRRIPIDNRHVNEITRFLDGQRVRTVVWPNSEGDKSLSILEARPAVQVELTVVADIETAHIALEIYNFRKAGHEVIPFRPDVAATDEWMDRLVGFILCKVDSLQEHRGLSENERALLHERLDEARERVRLFELKLDEMEREEQAQQNEQRSARSRVRNLVSRIAPRILDKS